MVDHDTISSLAGRFSAAGNAPLPPVDTWNPPYCGDIGLRIAPNGMWFYRNSPITRQPMVRLFARILRKDADGKHYLVTPTEKVFVAVDDAPFLAVELNVTDSGRNQQLAFRTNTGDAVPCGPGHDLRFIEHSPGGGLKPYLRVRGNLDALLTRALYYEIAALAIATQEAEGGGPGIWSGGNFYKFEPVRP